MTYPRRLDGELLDHLPTDDPRAIRSRRDLRLCNVLMFQSTIMARLLFRHSARPPATMVDIGTGDGRAALAVARRLSRHWRGVRLTLVDRQNLVSDDIVAAFSRLGWTVERSSAEIFDFLSRGTQFDVMTANLFLHHFSDEHLGHLLKMASGSTKVFVAGEPRRDAAALFGCRLLPLLGCNEITRHDSVASVRAGFRGRELSALWGQEGWALFEHRAIPFSHCFAATSPRGGN